MARTARAVDNQLDGMLPAPFSIGPGSCTHARRLALHLVSGMAPATSADNTCSKPQSR